MTVRKLKPTARRIEALVAEDRDLLKALVKEALEEVLQVEVGYPLDKDERRPMIEPSGLACRDPSQRKEKRP
jgi:hypothetical protein